MRDIGQISEEGFDLGLKEKLPLILAALIVVMTMTADATYKDIEVGDGRFTVSYDIKGDPVTPLVGSTVDEDSIQMYYVFLKDNQNRSRTTIRIDISPSGFTHSGVIEDYLDGFSDVKQYSREVDGQKADVATGIHPKSGLEWTVFEYYLDPRTREGLPTECVLVYCSLPEANAGDLMNTLHVGEEM